MTAALKRIFRFLASTGLSVVLLLLLMLLTFLGTLQQVNEGLYQVQKEYFGSFVLLHWFGGVVPVPLPGAYLLMILVFINVTCGGIVRARKGWRQAGVLIGHAGVLLLLAGAFITFHYALRGHITLYEGEQTDHFQTYDEWEIQVAASGSSSALVIPGKEFAHLRGNRSRTFYSNSLPFELIVSGYAPNATRMPVSQGQAAAGKVVKGSYLAVIQPAQEIEQNTPGAYLTVKEKKSGAVQEFILSAQEDTAVIIDKEGWAISLRPRGHPLPFTVVLNKFARELYPGTEVAKTFTSEITKIEGDSRQPVKITMNEPLRHKGYTLYQASWGPPNAGPKDRLYSTLAVVKDPADQFPLYATLVVGLGLLVHFCMKLLLYLKAQTRERP